MWGLVSPDPDIVVSQAKQFSTRSGPKIPAAGYLEEQNKTVNTRSPCKDIQILELRQNNQISVVLKKVRLLVLIFALKVDSDHKFEFLGLHSLCEHGFFSPMTLY